jgi:hypothetical protein
MKKIIKHSKNKFILETMIFNSKNIILVNNYKNIYKELIK